MPLLPIAARELNVIARGKGLYRMRLRASLLAILAMLWMLLFGAAQVAMADQGTLLFWLLSGYAFAYCSFAGMIWTAGSFNAEKRDGTLGLLFLTGLRRQDVVFGKIVSSSVSAVFALLGIVPVLALGLLLGGVQPDQLAFLLCVLAAAMLLSLAAGAFSSVVCESDGRALFLTALILFVANLGPFVMNLAIDADSFRPDLATGSPLAAFAMLWPSLGTFSARAFILTMAVVVLASALLLMLAIVLVERGAFEQPSLIQRLGWKEWWRQRARLSLAGRARRLDENPYSWLADRTRSKQTYPWILLISLALIWVCMTAGREGLAFSAGLAFLYIAQGLLKYWTAEEICPRLIEDRRSGGLELILCTPMSARELLQGQLATSRRHFSLPAMLLVLLFAAAFFAGFDKRISGMEKPVLARLCFSGIILLPLDLWTIQWLSIATGLSAREGYRAALSVAGKILVLPALIFAAFLWSEGFLARFLFPGFEPSGWFDAGAWFAICIGIDLYFGFKARHELLKDFRERSLPAGAAAIKATPSGSFRRLPFSLRVASASAIVLAVLGLCLWSYRHGLQRAIRAEMAQLRAEGEPTSLAELKEIFPLLPAEENGAFYYRQALMRSISTIRLSKNMPGQARANNFRQAGNRIDPAVLKEIEAHLQENSAALALIRAAPAFEQSFYSVDFEEGYPPLWWRAEFRKFNDLARTLQAAIILESAQGRVDDAIHDLKAGFLLLESLEKQPFAFSQRVRMYAAESILDAFEALLSQHQLPESVLGEFGTLLQNAEAPGSVHRALQADLVSGIITYSRPLRAQVYFWAGSAALPPAQFAFFSVIHSLQSFFGSTDADYLYYLRRMHHALKLSRLEYPAALDRSPPSGHDGSAAPLLSNRLLPWTQQIGATESKVLNTLRAAQAATAVERARSRLGALPASLQALKPEFLPDIPLGAHGGRPLTLLQMGRGYQISEEGDPRALGGGFTVER